MRTRSLVALASGSLLAATALAGGTLITAPAASATDMSAVLDNPAYWQAGDQADVIQFINMSYGASHPRYSTHRVDVLLDDGGRPVSGTTYLKLTTNFPVISGTVTQDEFVSAVTLPAGVRIVDSQSSPIFCRIAPNGLFSDSPVPFQLVVDGTCRQKPKDLGGNTFAVNDKVLNRGDIWEVYVPVTSDRAWGAADGAAAAVKFGSTHANSDATEPAVAIATNILTVGAPTKSASSGIAAGTKCSKAGQRTGSLKCARSKGKLVWKRA
ncbi:MAG: hypothetical protein RL205_1778 [Actinomycetota bacterium]|jgi:hypothetical protein